MRLRIAKPGRNYRIYFELKHDGFRALAYVEEGTCKLVSRNSNFFKSFESLKTSLGKLRVQTRSWMARSCVLSGNGISQFNQLFSRQGKPVFYAFDLLWLNHEDFDDVLSKVKNACGN